MEYTVSLRDLVTMLDLARRYPNGLASRAILDVERHRAYVEAELDRLGNGASTQAGQTWTGPAEHWNPSVLQIENPKPEKARRGEGESAGGDE